MKTLEPQNLADLDVRWRLRRQYWARKLGRIRLGVEPVEVQLGRFRRVAWALTIVPGLMALMFMALFTAFDRPDVGLVVALLLFGPIAAFSWLGHAKMARRTRDYLAELHDYEIERGQRPSEHA